MAPEDLDERLDTITDKISARVREISAAVLALSWAFVFREGEPQNDHEVPTISLLFVPIAFSLLALVADFVQYLVSYRMHVDLLSSARRGVTDLSLDRSLPIYKVHIACWLTKLGAAIISVIWLVAVLGALVLK